MHETSGYDAWFRGGELSFWNDPVTYEITD
jgi:hypothetical protein